MANKLIGKLVQVNSLFARNPGGYGRVMRAQRGMYRVDSSAFPGQEVTGWYKREELVEISGDAEQQQIQRWRIEYDQEERKRSEFAFPQGTDGLIEPFTVAVEEMEC